MKTKLAIGVLVVALLGLGYAYSQEARFGRLPLSQNANNEAFVTVSQTQNLFIVGPITASTSSVTSTVALGRGQSWGLKLGSPCDVQLSTMSSTGGFSMDAYITAIAANAATATVTFFGGQPSGNVTIATGTITLYCHSF